MGKIINILEIGFLEGLVWFPIVLSIGLIYTYLKNIDISIDGIIILSSIVFVMLYNATGILLVAFLGTVITSLVCYFIVHSLIDTFKINDILAGIIFTLLLHSFSVLLITESIPLNHSELTLASSNPAIIIIVVFVFIAVEYFFNTRLGTKLIIASDNSNFNSKINPNIAQLSVYLIAGFILSIGAILYSSRLGMSRSGGGFEFLITALSSFLFVNRIINYFVNLIKDKLSYSVFKLLTSPVLKALLGSILFQIIVMLIIFYTKNPIYWKLLFGILLLLLVADYKNLLVRKRQAIGYPEVDTLLLDRISFAYTDNYKIVEVLNKLTIKFKTGINIIWGSNGSGKSTILKLIAGELTASEGTIIYKTKPISFLTINQGKIFFITQNPYDSLSTRNTVYENKEASKKHSLLELFSIPRRKNIKPGETVITGALSGGQAQRLNMELCYIYEPEVILADEPTSGMDHDNYLNFIKFIKRESALGKTIIIVSHDKRFKEIDCNQINLDKLKLEAYET